MNTIQTGCKDCYYCINGQCLYASPCNGTKKWSDKYNCFIPKGYRENSKTEKVLKELKPIADLLGIDIDYVITDEREYLVCNGQKICTNETSISGIRQEFFGYVFLREWRDRSLGAFDKQTRHHIKQYWYDDEFNQPWLKW